MADETDWWRVAASAIEGFSERGADVAERREEAQRLDTRTAIEKQSAVVDVLRQSVGRSLSADDVLEALRMSSVPPVDLSREVEVDQMLRCNVRIRVQLDDEGARYAYVARFDDVRDGATLISRIAKTDNGVAVADVLDCYVGVEADVEAAIIAGNVIALKDASEKNIALFPRHEPYLVLLSGSARLPHDADRRSVTLTRDVQTEVRRGDAIALLDEHTLEARGWFRVSSRVHASNERPQPARARRPLSASSLKEMHSQNVYCDPFDPTRLPLSATTDALRSSDAGGGFVLAKHGCTNDVRTLWLETAADTPDDHAQLERKLVESGVNAPAANRAKRPKVARRQDTAPRARARHFNRFQKLTNVHLVGTAIGDVLAAANDGDTTGSTGNARFEASG
ncbi:hypothetical protein M885DRAFT_560728 [Pelagophyceae sp. CCMP2097]|nr:hypothetical protein M885DRAFT_560728 [Pelagophyceae sp. CCMP2097]